ncbi:MAG: hypothetical protein J5702_01435 [Bacteroidales bacterium]|nr:hypothetical protein [Bacteroidales bacterium]
MKRFFIFASICLSILLASSCGASSELTFNQNQLQTSVVLSQSNFIVVKNVCGEASATYFLVFGGYRTAEAKAAAMNEMILNAELTGSQAIVNANISTHVQTVLGIYTKVTAYATGTVIEFY